MNIGAVDSGPSLDREGGRVRKRKGPGDSLLCRQLFSLIISVPHFLLSMFFFPLSETYVCLSKFTNKAGVGQSQANFTLGRGELVFTPGPAHVRGDVL